jgi:hypothetical protein
MESFLSILDCFLTNLPLQIDECGNPIERIVPEDNRQQCIGNYGGHFSCQLIPSLSISLFNDSNSALKL